MDRQYLLLDQVVLRLQNLQELPKPKTWLKLDIQFSLFFLLSISSIYESMMNGTAKDTIHTIIHVGRFLNAKFLSYNNTVILLV